MGIISNKARLKEQFGRTHCEICGEVFKLTDEVGEFVKKEVGKDGKTRYAEVHVIAHAQCGLDFELPLA